MLLNQFRDNINAVVRNRVVRLALEPREDKRLPVHRAAPGVENRAHTERGYGADEQLAQGCGVGKGRALT